MREVVTRGELHRLFGEELRKSGEAGSVFVFEIDHKPAGPGACDWYPLASIELWTGDLAANLRVFSEVRQRLAARYRLSEEDAVAAGAAPREAVVV